MKQNINDVKQNINETNIIFISFFKLLNTSLDEWSFLLSHLKSVSFNDERE